jgi:pimeloyl-ACP methyl ester carboxylesterase
MIVSPAFLREYEMDVIPFCAGKDFLHIRWEDFVVSAEASLDHDASDRLEAIGARSLVVGGAQDRLFPTSLQGDTAERIPLRCGSSRE